MYSESVMILKTGIALVCIIFCICAHESAINQSQLMRTMYQFKPLEESDLPLLKKWFEQSHVSYWWPVPKKEEEFFGMFLPRIRSKETSPFMIYLDEKPIGYIQYYIVDKVTGTEKTGGKWLPELPKNTVGIDQFIGEPDYLYKGHGAAFIKEFLKFLRSSQSHIDCVIVDPEPENKAAIRCYEKAGFLPLGIFISPGGPHFLMRYDYAQSSL